MSLTDKAHQIISKKSRSIKSGIDATCGNGNDTLFLAKLCSKSGKILSFDIQEVALRIAKSKIKNANLCGTVKFIHDSHENMKDYINDKAEVIMFNLGYLPNADNKVSTKSETTIYALSAAKKLLSDNGLISIICYPGHEDGRVECRNVRTWLNNLDQKKFSILEYLSESPNETTPILFILMKNE